MSDPNVQPPVDPTAGQNPPPPPPPYQPPPQQAYQRPPQQAYQQPPQQGYPQAPQQPYAPVPATPLSPSDDKLWATLSMFLNIILLIPALIIYLVFKDRGERVRNESKEALNWTINVTGLYIVIWILSIVLSFIPIIGFVFGLLFILILWALAILNIVFSIIGGVRVNAGGSYRYPVNYRWIK
jgi:uncharacterized protein